jgi:hypothetical protein
LTTWKVWSSSAGACDECASLDGETIEEDDDFDAGWGMISDPEDNHPGCNCDLTLYDIPDDMGYAETLARQIMD